MVDRLNPIVAVGAGFLQAGGKCPSPSVAVRDDLEVGLPLSLVSSAALEMPVLACPAGVAGAGFLNMSEMKLTAFPLGGGLVAGFL